MLCTWNSPPGPVIHTSLSSTKIDTASMGDKSTASFTTPYSAALSSVKRNNDIKTKPIIKNPSIQWRGHAQAFRPHTNPPSCVTKSFSVRSSDSRFILGQAFPDFPVARFAFVCDHSGGDRLRSSELPLSPKNF